GGKSAGFCTQLTRLFGVDQQHQIMAPIPIKRVVSVSSEDESNPATNLLQGCSGRKWLTRQEEKARRAEVVVELSKRARINSLELGNFGSAFIEVHVSAAASESSTTEWLTLLPSCMLMTVPDSRAGRNKTSSIVCSRDRFSATTAGLKWSFLKIICRQPYNLTSQFGLQHVTFYSDTPSTPLTPSPSPSLLSHPDPSHSPKDTPDYANRHRLPSLPSSATPCKPGDPHSSRPLTGREISSNPWGTPTPARSSLVSRGSRVFSEML
ncbi:DNA repair protein XRCC1, partial [Geodia barretti]